MAPAMDKNSLGEVAASLARRWATQRLAAVQTYGRILADYGEGRSSSGSALGALVKLAAEEAIRYPADAVGLVTDYAAAAARQAGVDLGAETKTSGTGVARASRPIQDLELSGSVGGEARGEFFLRNPHDRPATLSFFASHFTGAAGDTQAAPAVTPSHLVLAAGEERAIRVAANLDGETFQAGKDYTANVAIAGFDDMVVRIRLTVLETA
jgi:hypothetical protein